MNHLVWPTALLALTLFWLGTKVEPSLVSHRTRTLLLLAATLLALPGLLFASYYTKLLGEPIWLYRFRSIPGTELTASGMGLLAGFVHEARHRHKALRRQLRVFTLPTIFALALFVPYLKPLIRPLDLNQMTERWEDGVCLQSSPSTCGPASAATILRSFGEDASELELARESLSYAGGTENWYLARALRKRGHPVEFTKLPVQDERYPTPSIAGVKLSYGTGHFIALIGREGSNYVASDPLTGKFTATPIELRASYRFTGFFLLIK